MFYLHPGVIWAIAMCCLCVLLYLCTFASYLKGVRGSIAQMVNLVPMAELSPKMRSTAVSVFVIDVEQERRDQEYHHVYNKGATLNLEALAKESDAYQSRNECDFTEKSDSLTNLLVCDGKNKNFSI